MSENSGDRKVIFRNNVVGGFNKTDVIDYISRQTREQEKINEELKLSVEELERDKIKSEQRITELGGSLADSESKLRLAAAEIERLEGALKASEAAVEAAEAKYGRLLDGLSALLAGEGK